MLRKLLIVIVLGIASLGSKAQALKNFWSPIERPSRFALSVAADNPIVVNSLRPVAEVSASFSNGTQLVGGFGIAWQSNVYDPVAQVYNTRYSFGLVGGLGTTGSKITGSALIVGAVPGTNGTVVVGGGRDFTQGEWVIATGVQFKFN